ncbi:MAG: bifunctional DNA-formamidopyrimidine glycosylase/DNA-(apurinic or apyrimidinic site) lyase [Chloroflexi bacterium]|nr:bifunctional DNA-formamidopyrimidine glycosylase/DNA-(apurinic or apyrimidinic site) lyase [Chloroflexota bacterium]
MPELPEVETIRQGLLPLVVGRTVVEASVSPEAPRLVAWPPRADDLCRGLAGQRIEGVGRRGKYLLFALADGRTWVVHLRMTGVLVYRPQGCGGGRFLRASFRLDNGASLCFADLRKMGRMWLVDDPAQVVGKLGPEPLSEGFTAADLGRLLARRSAPVKAVLLDQGAIAGIGNIYADEALFEARVHPRRPASSLSGEEVRRLHKAVGLTLVRAMGDRGSSFDHYVDARGEKGSHHLNVKVFRRTDEACFECGSLIQRIKVAGRSTHFCPQCQV